MAQFQLYKKPPFDNEEHRRDLLHRVNEIEGVALPDSAINSLRGIRLSLLSNEQQFSKLLSAMDWFVEELRKP